METADCTAEEKRGSAPAQGTKFSLLLRH